MEFTLFDFAIFAIIFLSMVMAFARGFLREISSILAFIGGALGAYFAVIYFAEPFRDALPSSWPALTPTLILALGAFLVAYMITNSITRRLAGIVRVSDNIGGLDRLVGGLFGLIRGYAIIVLTLVCFRLVLPETSLPNMVREAWSYPHILNAAQYVENVAPGLAKQAQTVLEEAGAKAMEAAEDE